MMWRDFLILFFDLHTKLWVKLSNSQRRFHHYLSSLLRARKVKVYQRFDLCTRFWILCWKIWKWSFLIFSWFIDLRFFMNLLVVVLIRSNWVLLILLFVQSVINNGNIFNVLQILTLMILKFKNSVFSSCAFSIQHFTYLRFTIDQISLTCGTICFFDREICLINSLKHNQLTDSTEARSLLRLFFSSDR